MLLQDIPILCIHLESQPERWRNLEWQALQLGLTIHKMPATTPEEVEQVTEVRFDKNQNTARERSCAYSHYRLWKLQVERGWEVMLILEDDAVFRADIVEVVNRWFANPLAPDWECLFLNVSEPTRPNHWSIAHDQLLTGGYILRLEGAHRLISLTQEWGLYASDVMTVYLQRNGRSWTYFPWLIIQQNKESTLRDAEVLKKVQEKVERIFEEYRIPWRDLYLLAPPNSS